MAGFMAGFGEAFATSFQAAKKRKFEEEQTKVERDFQKAMKEQEWVRQLELQDRQDAREAARFAREETFRKAEREANQQFQLLTRDQDREERKNERLTDRVYRELDRGADQRREDSIYERTQRDELEKEKRGRGYKEEDRKAEDASFKDRLKYQHDLDKAKDSEDALMEARALGRMYDTDGDIDPALVQEFYSLIKSGVDVEKKLEDGWIPEFSPHNPKNTTDPLAPAKNAPSAASEQTSEMLSPASVTPETPEAASTKMGVTPEQTRVQWKRPATKNPYDDISTDDWINRKAMAEPGSPEWVMADQALQEHLAYEELKALKTGMKTAPGIVIERPTDGNRTGKFTPVYQDSNGNYFERSTDRPITNFEPVDGPLLEEWNTLQKDNAPQVQKYQDRALVLSEGINTAKNMKDILARNPNANALGGTIAKVTDEWARDIVSGVDQIAEITRGLANSGNPNGLAAVDKAVDEMEATVDSLISQGVQSDALDAALLESYKLRMTYAMLASQGQQGRSVNQQEFDKMYADLSNSNPQSVFEKLDNWVEDTVTSLKVEHSLLNEHNNKMMDFANRFNIEPMSVAVDPETFVQDYTFSARGNETIQNQQMPQPDTSGLTPIGKTPDGKIIYEDEQGNRGTLD